MLAFFHANGARQRRCAAFAALCACISCGRPAPPPVPSGNFAFGVFGDGPYRAWEMGRFRALTDDVNAADLAFFIHVGDILWYPCSDEAFEERLGMLNGIRHPLIYTPGDNEWADCHEEIAGAYEPLDRLQQLRSTFFAHPDRSLGGHTIALESQRGDPEFAEFVENARWEHNGLLFATLHLVGSGNATAAYPGRSAREDAESARRMNAALAWLDQAFAIATSDRLRAVILALHANVGLERGEHTREPYVRFVDRLEEHVTRFRGPVLLIHGDSHTHRVDRPLRSRSTGAPLTNFTRLEVFGSPDIGWVRVVVDSLAGKLTLAEPRLMPKWILW